MTLILSNEDVAAALDVEACLTAMTEAYAELAESRASQRPTSHSYLPHALPQATYSFKSVEGAIKKTGILALRVTSDIVQERPSGNSMRLDKLPLAGGGRFVGLVQLFSVETGELLAIMPDGVIQQTRVAVTSALGTRALARPDSRILALVGSGGQARAHLRYLQASLGLGEVRLFSPNEAHRTAFAAEMGRETGLPIRPCDHVAAAIEGADIVCTATNASRPVFGAEHLAPGMHYTAIREFEMDEAALARCAPVIIHTRFGGIQHYQPPGTVGDLPGVRREKPRDWSRYPEIQDLLAGKVAGRSDAQQITFFFNNVGTGVQFAAVGAAAYAGAREKRLGQEIPSGWFMQDIKP
jgi:ornithine cyclodeaminase/alanine dehydrogenase-like protein (mu-crystallin family)